ncbi:MAG: DUF2062 domain-containing protein [Lentisphaeria bacterium]|nr:DUF2062 domain-containing protein [Lentisphaeria bacterium]
MDETPRILAVIPVYNHPDRLREVVERTLAVHADVLVVDDGSSPPVSGALEALPIVILRHDVNQGKGKAVRTAAVYAAEHGFSHIATLDADGQHDPEDLPALIAAIERCPDAVVLGVRDFSSEEVPGSSRFGRSFGNFWVWVQTREHVRDIQSGFRAYPVRLLTELGYFCSRYAFEVETVVRALWAGLPVEHVDVQVHYPDPELRTSHFSKWRDNLAISVLNTHLTLRSVVPWPHRQLAGSAADAVSVWHPVRSVKRLVREHASPRELALAVAVGIFLGAAPLIACHTVAILVVAAWFRLNRVVAVAASQLCMPPLMPMLCIEAGYFLRKGRFLTLQSVDGLRDCSFVDFGWMGVDRLLDWFLGSLVVGTAAAALLGGAAYVLARALEKRGGTTD